MKTVRLPVANMISSGTVLILVLSLVPVLVPVLVALLVLVELVLTSVFLAESFPPVKLLHHAIRRTMEIP